MERKATEILPSASRSKFRAIGISSRPNLYFLGTNWGYLRCSSGEEGKVSSLSSLLSLTLSWFTAVRGALGSLFEKADPGRAQLISSNRRLNKYFKFIRCKSKRQIGSLIVAAQNSIKPCIGLIGANGIQREGGVGLFTTTRALPDLTYSVLVHSWL